MRKEVRLDNERIVRIESESEDESSRKEIVESFSVDGLECANYSLIQDDKYYFRAELDIDSISENSRNKLVFIIDINHPLYLPFHHLLNNGKEIILKDNDNDEKYLGISKEDDKIYLNFVDKVKDEKLKDKFTITYDSNLGYLSNAESVKNNDLKERLKAFFVESYYSCEKNHQISFEEYTLRKEISERERLSS